MGSAYEVIENARNRTAWLRARRDGLGGSESAAVLGVSPWQSALEVYAEKVSSEAPVDAPPSEYAKWGHILEPHVIAEFAKQTGRAVKPEGRLLRSRARPWQLTTLDARQRKRPKGPPGFVEVKTTRFEWDRIPEDIWAQMQHQFAVTKMRYGSIVVFNRSSCETTVLDVKPDPEYIGELIEMEEKFWRDLEQGIPPDPDGSESARATLRRLYPIHVPGKEVMLVSDLIDVGLRREEAKASVKVLNDEIRECENKLTVAIGDAELGILPDGTSYTYRQQHRKETIQKATSFRVLRRKEAA